MQKAFHLFGVIFFICATMYFSMLIWKSYVWYNWLNQLEQQLYKQQPPSNSPLVGDDHRLSIHQEYKNPLTNDQGVCTCSECHTIPSFFVTD